MLPLEAIDELVTPMIPFTQDPGRSDGSAGSVSIYSNGRNIEGVIGDAVFGLRGRGPTAGIGVWLAMVASAALATGIHAAEAEAQPNAWAQLLRPNDIAWPEQPAQVELFGRTWHRV